MFNSISKCFLYVSLDEHPCCSWKKVENSGVLPDPRTTGKPARQPSKALFSSKLWPQPLQHFRHSGPLPQAWPPPADYKLPGAKNFLASQSVGDQASVNVCEQKELSLFNKEQQSLFTGVLSAEPPNFQLSCLSRPHPDPRSGSSWPKATSSLNLSVLVSGYCRGTDSCAKQALSVDGIRSTHIHICHCTCMNYKVIAQHHLIHYKCFMPNKLEKWPKVLWGGWGRTFYNSNIKKDSLGPKPLGFPLLDVR